MTSSPRWLLAGFLAVALGACGEVPSGSRAQSGEPPGGSGGHGGGTGGEGGAAGGSAGSGGEAGAGGAGGVLCLPPRLPAELLQAASTERVHLRFAAGGRVLRVSGAFPIVADKEEEAARLFLAEHAPLFGLATAAPGELELRATRRGLAGNYLRFRQRALGLPVFDAEVVVLVGGAAPALVVRSANLALLPVAGLVLPAAPLSPDEALALAVARTGFVFPGRATPAVELGVLSEREPVAAYRVTLAASEPAADHELFLAAADGAPLLHRDRLQRADGSGLVFDPNPVCSTGDPTLDDAADQSSPVLDAARTRVVLPRLDGSGALSGDFVDARPSSLAARAVDPGLVFDYDRSDNRFEEVMAYFHLDRVQARFQQELGFTDVNSGRQVVVVNAITDDQSWYSPQDGSISTGSGGVDDGEDADILVHEYGHAIQNDQVPGFGMGDEDAMGEGFGDYLAAAMLDPLLGDPACVGDWDATAYSQESPPCLRRVDGSGHWPEALEGESHADGELWSAALWALHRELGADVMATLVLEHHFSLSTRESFEGAVAAILDADRQLYAGQHVDTLYRGFVAQGLTRVPTPPSALTDLLTTVAVDLRPPLSGGEYRNRADDSQWAEVPGAQALRLHFASVDTEADGGCVGGVCDNIYLGDAEGRLYQVLGGSRPGGLTSVAIPGDRVRIRLVTDPSIGGSGYHVDAIEVLGTSVCGDGQADPGEVCDGADLGASSCELLGYREGTLTCRENCTVDATGCGGPIRCGDGILDPGEPCDGAELGGVTCVELGFTAGTPTCRLDCTLDPGRCSTCGDGVIAGAEACDGAQLGGASCESLGLGGGAVFCSAACTLDSSGCSPPCP